MNAFRQALWLPGTRDERAAVLDDLSTMTGLPVEECLRRCIHWEQLSVSEWKSADRRTSDDIADFYRTTQSWAFDLLWYAYLQAAGWAYPVSVAIARTLPSGGDRLEHADFGSGVGATSQLFAALGYRTTLADISTSLLAFARFRLERRATPATYVDLNGKSLDVGRYDVITAIDTLAHVPDVPAASRALHQALRPGGVLFANFDVRPKSTDNGNAWHLYDDDRPLRCTLHRAGFDQVESLDGQITRYQSVRPHGVAHHARAARDLLLLRSPARRWYRAVKSAAMRGRDMVRTAVIGAMVSSAVLRTAEILIDEGW